MTHSVFVWRSGRDSNPRHTVLQTDALPLSYADQTAGLPRLSCVTDFRIAMAFHFNVPNHHTPRLSRVTEKKEVRPKSRAGASAGLRTP